MWTGPCPPEQNLVSPSPAQLHNSRQIVKSASVYIGRYFDNLSDIPWID